MVFCAASAKGQLNCAPKPVSCRGSDYLLETRICECSGTSRHPIIVSNVAIEVLEDLKSSAIWRLSSRLEKKEGEWKPRHFGSTLIPTFQPKAIEVTDIQLKEGGTVLMMLSRSPVD